MRKLTGLGLAPAIVLALCAVAASSASASYSINGQASGGKIVASQATVQEFFTDVGTLKCSTAIFSGSQATETASTLTVAPTYPSTSPANCFIAGLRAGVTTTGCTYTFQTPVTGSPTSASVNLACSAGSTIFVKSLFLPGCEITISPQTLSKFSFVNNASTVTITAAVTGIAYSWSAGCISSPSSPGSNSNGKYTGSVTAEGFTSSGVANKIEVT